ncbi:MAG: hypothetical protein CMI13_14215 [Oleibacter sp.]|nr:hypothetical protein [Thalassolituus sp.]
MPRFYILQRQPLREQEWLLDIFSEQDGRLTVVAGPRQRGSDMLQLLQGSWSPDQDWPKVRAMECLSQPVLSGVSLYCAFYLTELLTRLLPRYEALPDLFRVYHQTLAGLAQNTVPDPWLRLFEVELLAACGYGFSWRQDDSGAALQPDGYYRFIPRQGFSPAAEGFRGRDIMDFAVRNAANPQAWQIARNILRQAIDNMLERPLVSRELVNVNRYRLKSQPAG